MNNDNPLIPQGSLLEQRDKSRSRVKTAFFCVLGVHVLAILTALIAQGCKREQPPVFDDIQAPVPIFEPTNTAPLMDPTLPLPPEDTNVPPPADTTLTPPPPPATTAREHVIARGDSFYSIGKQYGVSTRAIADANPGVDPLRLQVGQKINVPPPPEPGMTMTPSPGAGPGASEQIYVVKSGDNLTKIANKFGTTVKELRSVNNLRTDRIKVGDKLKIPVKPVPPPFTPGLQPGAVPPPGAIPSGGPPQ